MRSNEKSNKKEKDVEESVRSGKNSDEKKKNNDSDDKKDDEKRRDSVTGSPLDTTSSSNSSVDSDEIDATERKDSKSTITSADSKPSVDSHEMDVSIDEIMKNIPKCLNMGLSDTCKSILGIKEDGKDEEKMDGLGKDAEEKQNGPKRCAKKSRRRNRRNKKKRNATHQDEMLSNETKDEKKITIEAFGNGILETEWKSELRVVREQEAMNIDGMEASNLLYMTDASYKFSERFTYWIQKFYFAAIDGEIEEFVNKLTCIMRVLKRGPNNERYKRMSQQQFKEHVMSNVIAKFFDASESTSVLHHLAPTKNTDLPCDMRNHNCCKMIRIILDALTWKDRRVLLALCTKRTGKTAMHLAAASGQSCQMQALMDFGAWPDLYDHSGRAPIHYAIMRNNLEMVRMLLWYGTDLSLRERSATPLQLAGFSLTTVSICEYLHARMTALEKIYMQWVKKYVRGVWTPIHAISDLHFVRLTKACDSGRDACRNLITKWRKVCINFPEVRMSSPQLKKCPLMLLFIVPTFYKQEDRIADASNPQIFCTNLENPNGSIIKLIPARPLLSCSKWSVGIKSALEKPHNGYFYVYKLPDNIEADSYALHFTVELEELSFRAPHIALAIQAFGCGPPTLEHYNELRGLTTPHKRNKSKMD